MKRFLRKYLKVIDLYIIRKYLGTFMFTLAIFSVVMVVFDISEHLDNFLKKKIAPSMISPLNIMPALYHFTLIISHRLSISWR